ncbi:Ig-like domain-containing protein [Runella aurantiaca]|uniref:Ig-like domain-containing protein n=1 Tax=Runella aurantiaca TaxID=2282308 RepID=A0A369I6C1_9BACT|nr:hypothetical protein [Runella aurantiaca]RDB05148.1 hypothetical protein DVG78_14800 [Runella aurantiaca]
MAIWYICSYCTVYNSAFAQSNAITVKTIICPNLCKGESAYLLVFEATTGKVSTNRGTVRNDTIAGILPKNDFKVTLTFTSVDSLVSTQIVPLPICDPILPLPPLVSSQSLCAGSSITPFKAFATDGATVDWYADPHSSIPLKSETLQFTPTQAGTYYARSRYTDTGCTSIASTPVVLEIKRAVCPVIGIRKVRK